MSMHSRDQTEAGAIAGRLDRIRAFVDANGPEDSMFGAWLDEAVAYLNRLADQEREALDQHLIKAYLDANPEVGAEWWERYRSRPEEPPGANVTPIGPPH